MDLYSWNVNGIRAAQKKGLLEWIKSTKADVIALQEIKATPEQLEEELIHPFNYHSFWLPAQKAGYSGVATYSKEKPLSVQYGIGIKEFDEEGRVLVLEFNNFFHINCYFPNSQRDHARLDYKLKFCQEILKFSKKQAKKGKGVILCGDLNIAHKEIDLKNPKSNQNNAGFLPEERACMDKLLESFFVDTFRLFEPGPDHYTWWSYRPGVRQKNIGWRLDYHLVNKEFVNQIKSSFHCPDIMGSDHCPVGLKIKN